MVHNPEIINLLKATVDHNTKQANAEMKGADNEKDRTLIKAGFDEIISGHFDLLKMFVFIDLLESNNLDINHLNDLVDQHLSIINEELEENMNDAARKKVEYNKKLWETVKEKMGAYMELLSPVE